MGIIQLVMLGANIFVGYLTSNYLVFIDYNKDKNVHRFSLSAWRGELLENERETEREGERDKKHDTQKKHPLRTLVNPMEL